MDALRCGRRARQLGGLLVSIGLVLVAGTSAAAPASAPAPLQHVLLISVDGLHAIDLQRFVREHPDSALAGLVAHGLTYTQARTPAPADSFPGLLALVTGGTPAATGVYYDVGYDRALSPPGSGCRSRGTVVRYDETADLRGAPYGAPQLDPAKLPLDPARGCMPLAPHRFLRVNTVFDVVHAAGGRTAWADKHPVYEIVSGPSGDGVDELFTPEIGDNFRGLADAGTDRVTASVSRTAAYDRIKARAVRNWIAGRTHDGAASAPVPALFGLNLQAVSVGQKRGGYLDASGRPSAALALALRDTDALIGSLVQALRTHGLLDSTLVALTAKHGNGPIDPARRRLVARTELVGAVRAAAGTHLAHITSDAVALIWLDEPDARTIEGVAAALASQRAVLGIEEVLHGPALVQAFGLGAGGTRRPDLVIVPRPGVIYAAAGDDKRAEHGGFSDDDRHVALLLSNPLRFPAARRSDRPVGTAQVAPTMLAALGLNPQQLEAVQRQSVPLLPGAGFSARPADDAPRPSPAPAR
jgi:hypothetical protein